MAKISNIPGRFEPPQLLKGEPLDWPREQTVGTHIRLSDEAPIPRGLVVTVMAP